MLPCLKFNGTKFFFGKIADLFPQYYPDLWQVERTQQQFLRLLERRLYSSVPRAAACAGLAALLHAVTCVREMADIKKARSITHTASAQCSNTENL